MQHPTRIYKSMPAVHRVGTVVALAALAVIILGACELPYSESVSEHGSLRISIDSGDGLEALTLLPDISMQPAHYIIRGSGPLGATFEVTTVGGVADIHDLRSGDWSIQVEAINADGIEIGYGSDGALVEPAATAAVSVAVRPLSGTGSLSLSVSWPADQVQAPSISASLTNREGHSQQLQFEHTASGAAAYANNQMDAGYYTLAVQLLDSGGVIAGAVETVRIVHGGHTEGAFSFDDLNHPTGDIDIVITPDMDQPLEVAIEGALTLLAYGENMTASALVANANGAQLDYAWYLNGIYSGGGQSLQLGAELARGNYRLDVVVFTTDGSRSGSAGHSFRVE